MSCSVTVLANGRMSLPVDLRRRLGLEKGGTVTIEEVEDGVVLRTIPQNVRRAQELVRAHTVGVSVDDFLRFRRADGGE